MKILEEEGMDLLRREIEMESISRFLSINVAELLLMN